MINIISFNNGYYVQKTINQLSAKNVPLEDITVLDNNSTEEETLHILATLKCNIRRFNVNHGHNVWQIPEIWDNLPEYFIITDPDLEYNEKLPNNFIEIMKEISILHQASKVGFALEIENQQLYEDTYYFDQNIREWESKFWVNKLGSFPISPDNKIDLFDADIDTTFFLGCKSRFHDNIKIRLASNFTAKHLPWYPQHNFSLGAKRLLEMYYNAGKISTTSRLILSTFTMVHKNEKQFYVQIDKSHRNKFWLDVYKDWEAQTFNVLDEYVKKDRTVINIGVWIGATTLYCATLGAKIIAIEADRESCVTLKNNISLNNFENIKVIEKAIYKDNNGVLFGENLYRNDGMNASTSQIVFEHTFENSNKYKYKIDSITFAEVVRNVNNICLIKVDIEGGEQFILREVLEYCYNQNIPAYVSFHYTWWSSENQASFSSFQSIFSLFGYSNLIDEIIDSPFRSILFVRNN
jgi:FkbM family methyltransferase